MEGATRDVKKRRASKPKVRTGCTACKNRRVKCDETKPTCYRCQEYGAFCEYKLPPPHVAASKVTPPQDRGWDLVPIQPRRPLQHISSPSDSFPCDEVEGRYFRLFHEELAFDLSGYFEAPFWTRLIPQQCHHEPAIKHAILALSALYKSAISSKTHTVNLDDEHFNFALVQQSQAISSLRKTLSSGRPQMRLALVASLLFSCFESFHGDWETATQQIYSGLNILKPTTWSTHIVPAISGIESLEEGTELWTNRDAVAANSVPEHLIILGCGPVGSEMATFYSAIGSKVTLISSTAEILPKVEPEAAKIVRKSLEASGVSIKLSLRVSKIEKHAANSLTVVLSNGETISGSVLLNATGRWPRTFDFGLESIGLTGEGQPLQTDASLAVPTSQGTAPWLFAVGDVNGLGPTTHMGVYQARIASNAILSSIRDKQPSVKINAPIGVTVTKAKDSKNTFPQVIFTEPNIGAVGHTLASAQSAGLKVRAVDSDFSIAGAWLYGDGQPGWARWVIEEGTDKLVGATFCCVEGSEFVNASQVAVVQGLTLKEMVHVVPPFPTRGEIWTYLLNAVGF